MREFNYSVLLVLAFALPLAAQEQKPSPQALTVKAAPPPYVMAHDRALKPAEELITEAADHTQYRVEFDGIKGDRVPAYLYVPKRKSGTEAEPLPAILLQYGSGGNKKTSYIVEIGKLFVARGFVVLTIDSPNQGERRNKDKNTTALGMASAETIMHYCGDYSRAVDFLAARREVDRERIGYVGISWGAITGIIYVAHDPRIKAMGSMVGGGNFLGLYSVQQAIRAACEGSNSSDPVCHVARIAPRPLLFINVTKDELIMRPWAESLHRAAGEGSKVVWLETDHYFRGLDRAEVCVSVIDFMAKHLTGKTSAGAQ